MKIKYSIFESKNIGLNEYVRTPISKEFSFDTLELAIADAKTRLTKFPEPAGKLTCLLAHFHDDTGHYGDLFTSGDYYRPIDRAGEFCDKVFTN